MGDKYEVWTWIRFTPEEPYEYVLSYGGPSLWRAMWIAAKCKREGAGCVKVYWR